MTAEQVPNGAYPDQACTDEGPQEPDGGVVTDLLTRVARRAVRRGTVADAGSFTSESISIGMEDGTRLAAEVRHPRSVPNRGAILFVHGFCGEKSENGLFDKLASRCVEQGFATVLYDWRGLGDSGGNFPMSTLNDHTADFASVAQWARSRFETPRLHAVGFSLGAAVVGLALRRQELVTSAAYLSPASRPFQSMWPRYSGDQLWNHVREHGVVEKPGSSVLLGAPILHSLRDTDLGPQAFDLNIPLLVCHGTGDVRIDCSHSRELAQRRNGTSAFRYVEFEGASHSFRPAEQCWDRLGRVLVSWIEAANDVDAPASIHDLCLPANAI